MYNIAIVEDEEIFSTQLNEYIEMYAKETGKEICVKIHDKPDLFLDNYRSNIDILFTDIKMPKMSGMELAEKLRKIDKELVIIFTTSFKQYAIEGYSFQAAGYLLKPVDYDNFKKTLNRAFNLIERNVDKFITIKSEGIFQKVEIKDIAFIEVFGRQLNFNLSNGKTLETKGTLSSLEEKLLSFGFVRCEHSYLVNLKYVNSVEKNDIIISDKHIPISRGTKKQFMTVLAEYLNNL